MPITSRGVGDVVGITKRIPKSVSRTVIRSSSLSEVSASGASCQISSGVIQNLGFGHIKVGSTYFDITRHIAFSVSQGVYCILAIELNVR